MTSATHEGKRRRSHHCVGYDAAITAMNIASRNGASSDAAAFIPATTTTKAPATRMNRATEKKAFVSIKAMIAYCLNHCPLSGPLRPSTHWH